MSIQVIRLGTARAPGEGPRLGTVRRPPRGVRKADIARKNYYDVWLPELSPSAELVHWAMWAPWTDARWRTFERKYRAEMKRPAAQHLIDALATLSRATNFTVGCYCEDASRCHRVILHDLLKQHGANVAGLR